MAFSYPGGYNTIPTLDLSGNLQVNFSRNIKNFAVNKIARITPVKKMRGMYLYFNPVDLARLPGGNTNQNNWAPGQLSPTGWHNQLGFEFREFTCVRKAFVASLDQMGVEQAEWPVVKTHTEALAQQAMTNRSVLVANLLTTSGNHISTHVVTATSLAGGFLNTGTKTNPVIMKALNAAAQIIQIDTIGRMQYRNLTVVMNPNTARKFAETAEINDMVAQSPFALAQLKGGDTNQNALFGLPPQLYGFNLVIEDTVYNSTNALAATAAPTYAWPDNKIVVLMREDDLEASEGAASFSAVHLMIHEDMAVEAKVDDWNRLQNIRVTDSLVPQFVAPVSAVLITNVFS
jgi:hypothetical protein